MKFVANDFTTELPDMWQDRSMITLVGPPKNGFASNVVIMREDIPLNLSIEDYALQQRKAALAEIPGIEIIDERPTKINGSPAFQRLHRFIAQGRQLQQAQTFILGHEVVFAITCTATVENFNESISSFQQIVNSFQIISKQ